MGGVLAIGVLIALIAGYIAYGNWLEKGIRPRSFDTKVSSDRLRTIFEQQVARTGWKVVDDGNPMVAQSSLVTGMRQQISLTTRSKGDRTSVVVGPQRWVTKWGVPKKAHTLRMRLNSFVNAVRASDGSVTVTPGELRGR